MKFKINIEFLTVIALFGVLLFFPNVLSAQQSSSYYSYKTVSISVASDTVCLDSFRFVPGTEIIKKGERFLVKNKDFSYLPETGCLLFDSSHIGSEISISARFFKSNVIDFKTFNKDPRIIEPQYAQNPFFYPASGSAEESDIFSKSGLNVQGNISRGVGVGNNQDLILSSDMNLQINGRLGNEINVEAAITDQNNPIQPEGNTQQLQDFDQVFIRFSRDSSSLTVGDFLMLGTRGDYFMKYYKKSRGIQFQYQDSFFGGLNKSTAEIAVSRGKFARNEIQGQEGNQGPYRLTGSNNEIFIIIISGTEAVFVDGKLLERGQQNDYVIDYNTGEITFMPKVLINQYSRIVIEFQYADRNYARSLMHGANVFQKGNITLRGGAFLEQDNRRQPFQQSLDLFDSLGGRSATEVLAEAGDNPFLMVIPNVRKFNTFQIDRIMYRQIDTVGFEVYQYTDNPSSDTVFYQVSFTRVGQGNGNYKQLVNLANGRAYQWVEPVGGIPQGEFEPVVQLVAPERLSMYTAGMDYKPDSNTLITIEMASSSNDKNTFSLIDNQNNVGFAGNIKVDRKDELKLGTKKKLLWQNKLLMEWADENFRYIERYREVEFERSWNRQYSNPSAVRTFSEERIMNFSGLVGVEQKLVFDYRYALYQRVGEFEGNQIGAGLNGEYKGFRISQSSLFIKSERLRTDFFGNSFTSQNNAFDTRGSLSKKLGANTVISADYIVEQSLFKADTTNQLENLSFRYVQTGIFIERSLGEQMNSRISYNRRHDYIPAGELLEKSITSDNLTFSIDKEGKKWKDRLNFTLNYRAIENFDTMQSVDLPDKTLLSRVEYQIGILKKSIISSTYYQIGTGQEQRREFTYIEVRYGQGTHVWNDYNENGLQEINEFEPAIFADQANFIKILLPTNVFIRSNTNEFNQSIRITPPVKWQSLKGARKVLSRFMGIGSYRADRRTTDNRLQTVLNPFQLDIADTALINLSSLLKGTLFFNRSNPKFGMEYNYQKNQIKQFLVQGFDSRNIDKNSLSVRMNFSPDWSLITQGEVGDRGFLSDFAPNRNYDFNFSEVFPELFWQPGKSFRVGAFYKYYEAFNKVEFGGESATWNEAGIEFRSFLKNLTTIDGKLSLIEIDFTGQTFSPVAYDMLKGFQNGTNINWQLLVGGKIGKSIQITLNYEGRNSETAPTVHVGRVEARYLF